MTGVRFDRFFASTAIAVLLCAGGTAFAGSSGDQDTSAPTETTSSVSDQPAAATDTAADPAMQATPVSAADAIPSEPPPANAAEPAEQPATAAEQPALPKVPSTAETSPASPKPPAASGGDEVPTPAANASPNEPAGTAATTVADGNTAITEKLRDLATGKFDRMLGGKKERATIEAYYASRDYAPLWLTDGKPNARAQAAIAYLGHVDADGLEPSDYPTPNFATLSDPAALAEAELRLSLSVIAYAHHAEVGRVHWSRVSGDIFYEPKVPAPGDVLAKIATAPEVGEALASYEPQSPGYLALKAKLAELRASKEGAGQTPIANGPALKIGAQDERVAQLRERLNVPGDDGTYDKALAEAVKRFQQEHELKPTGLLTPRPLKRSTAASPIGRSTPSSPTWSAGGGCRTSSAALCHGQPAGLYVAGHA
jgi:murein L,D-transpeptidase YcbB/YkuD